MNDEQSPKLDYASPDLKRHRIPSFRLATLLAMPGLTCWVCYFLLRVIRSNAGDIFAYIALLALWPAVACALVSLLAFIRFRRKSYPWYVVLNLIINISGLAFVFGDSIQFFYRSLQAVYKSLIAY